MANFSALLFQGFRPPKKFTPKFTSRIVGTPLQFHFLEPKIYSRRFSAYGGDQDLAFSLKTVSAFLKHAFREVTSGFCKGTVPGAPPLPSPGSLRMLKNDSKETYLVPPEGHISVKNMWTDSQVVQRYRTRGTPFPIHKAPRMNQKIGPKKTTWYQARRLVCAKARLRNPDRNLLK